MHRVCPAVMTGGIDDPGFTPARTSRILRSGSSGRSNSRYCRSAPRDLIEPCSCSNAVMAMSLNCRLWPGFYRVSCIRTDKTRPRCFRTYSRAADTVFPAFRQGMQGNFRPCEAVEVRSSSSPLIWSKCACVMMMASGVPSRSRFIWAGKSGPVSTTSSVFCVRMATDGRVRTLCGWAGSQFPHH